MHQTPMIPTKLPALVLAPHRTNYVHAMLNWTASAKESQTCAEDPPPLVIWTKLQGPGFEDRGYILNIYGRGCAATKSRGQKRKRKHVNKYPKETCNFARHAAILLLLLGQRETQGR